MIMEINEVSQSENPLCDTAVFLENAAAAEAEADK